MTDAVLALPAHLRRRLAGALEAGLLAPPYSAIALRSVAGIGDGGEAVVEVLEQFARLGVGGAAAAAWIRSIEEAAAQTVRPDLVWSGPEVPGLRARDTRRVFAELVGGATRTLWASTYAYFDGPRAFELLARRMEQVPDLRVTLILNVQRRWGDTTAADHLVRAFADRLWKEDWPGKVRPEVYYDPRSLEPGGPAGVLHAKAVVADGEAVLVTSANLTEAAFDRNIELGLLLRDAALAASVTQHFAVLIERGLLRPVPME